MIQINNAENTSVKKVNTLTQINIIVACHELVFIKV